MCSGSEAGLYLRLIDFVYHSTLVLSVIKKNKKNAAMPGKKDPRLASSADLIFCSLAGYMHPWWGREAQRGKQVSTIPLAPEPWYAFQQRAKGWPVVLDLRTTTSQKCAAVPRRARM